MAWTEGTGWQKGGSLAWQKFNREGEAVEEHGGSMELSDAPDVASGGRGAWVRLRFAAESVASATTKPAEKAQALEMASK